MDLVISTEEIVNGKLHFLCSEMLTLMLLSVSIYMIGIYDKYLIMRDISPVLDHHVKLQVIAASYVLRVLLEVDEYG